MVLKKTLESPSDCKEIKPVDPKGNQSWIFIGRTDAEVEAPITCSTNVKSWLIRKDSDAGKDLGQEEKRATEDNMVRCHYQLNGHEYEQTPGDSEGQRSLACCSPWSWTCQTQLILNNINMNTKSSLMAKLWGEIIYRAQISEWASAGFKSSLWRVLADFI